MVVLSNNSPVAGLKVAQIEKTIGRSVDVELPFSKAVNWSINTGEPFLITNPELPISMKLEDCAYTLSRDELKSVPPAAPSPTWQNVSKRMNTKLPPEAVPSIWKKMGKRSNPSKE